jgi:hypothetical protein
MMPQIGLTADFTYLIIQRGLRATRILQSYINRRTFFSYSNGASWTYHEAYTTGNTTKASDGTLKAASPVARIVTSQEENQRTDSRRRLLWVVAPRRTRRLKAFTSAASDVGVYTLTGSAGLASSGWQLLPPMDPGGMGELGIVEAEQGDNGS